MNTKQVLAIAIIVRLTLTGCGSEANSNKETCAGVGSQEICHNNQQVTKKPSR